MRDNKLRINWRKLAAQPGGPALIGRIADGEDFRTVLSGVATAASKQPNSFRLSAGCLGHIRALAQRLGVSQASVIEMAVRRLARREGR